MENQFYDEQETEEISEKKFYKIERGRNMFGVSAKGVQLSPYELTILTELAQFKLLNTKQLHLLHQKYHEIKIDTLQKKLKRWDKRGVIKRVNFGRRKGFGNDINIYRIDYEGVKILVHENRLHENVMNINLSRFEKIRNIDHFLATNQMVLETEIEVEELGVKLEKINTRNNFSQRFGLIPDFTLRTSNVLVHFEIDMGTEPLAELNSKIDRYAVLAREMPDYIHVVSISLLDDSYQTRKYYDVSKEKRAANIKKANIFREDIFESNLRIAISPFSETASDIYSLILNWFEYGTPDYFEQFVQRFKEKEPDLSVSAIDDSLIYSREVLDIHRNDFKFFEVCNGAGRMIDRLAVIILNDYDLKKSITMNSMIYYMQDNKFDTPITRLIGVYLTKKERENAKHGILFKENVLFTDLETLQSDDEERYFRSTSAYRTKKVLYI